MTGLAGYDELDVQPMAAGETIFRAGAVGRHMYVILNGVVEIRISDRVVDVIRPGGIFGELALVDARPRAGTAVARNDGKLLRLDEEQFQKLVKESPVFALKVLRTVVERLRKVNAMPIEPVVPVTTEPAIDPGDEMVV